MNDTRAGAWAKPTDELTLTEARAVLDDMRTRVEAHLVDARRAKAERERDRVTIERLTLEVAKARGDRAHTQGEYNRLRRQLRVRDEWARQHGHCVPPPEANVEKLREPT